MIELFALTVAKVVLVLLVTIVVTAVAAIIGDRVADHGGKP